MKRIITITLLLIISVCILASCNGVGETSSQAESSSAVQASSSVTESVDDTSAGVSSQPDQTSSESSSAAALPEYVPGSIELIPHNVDDFNFERKYREIYYTLDQLYIDYLDKEEQERVFDWLQKNSEECGHGEFREEMLLVTFIKRYNIPREDFDKIVEKDITISEKMGINTSHEEYEIPNGDIIYTFDNEIINHYYRYE